MHRPVRQLNGTLHRRYHEGACGRQRHSHRATLAKALLQDFASALRTPRETLSLEAPREESFFSPLEASLEAPVFGKFHSQCSLGAATARRWNDPCRVCNSVCFGQHLRAGCLGVLPQYQPITLAATPPFCAGCLFSGRAQTCPKAPLGAYCQYQAHQHGGSRPAAVPAAHRSP